MKNVDTLDIQLVVQGNRQFIDTKIKHKLCSDDTMQYGKYGFYKKHHPFLGFSFIYIQRGWYLLVNVEHSEMVDIETAEELQEKVIYVVTNYFDISRDAIIETRVVFDKNGTKKRHLKNLDLVEVNRIEYMTNYLLKNDDESLVVQDILRIAPDNFGQYSKGLYNYKSENKIRTNCTYTSKRNNSIALTVYFKEYERLEKEDFEGAEKHKCNLRTEVKVKNARLNYETKNRDKTLKNYYSPKMAQHYFEEYPQKVFYTETFYRLDIACLKIKANQGLPEFKKKRLCEFLIRVNDVGISDAKEYFDPTTFRKHIKAIRKMGINPLCFSKNINGKDIKIKQMDNFTLLKNGIDEDI